MPSLYEADYPAQAMIAEVGDSPALEMRADALGRVRCGSVTLTPRRMGPGRRQRRHSRHQAVAQPNTTFAIVREGCTIRTTLMRPNESLISELRSRVLSICSCSR